jgi:hypothetical protein
VKKHIPRSFLRPKVTFSVKKVQKIDTMWSVGSRVTRFRQLFGQLDFEQFFLTFQKWPTFWATVSTVKVIH